MQATKTLSLSLSLSLSIGLSAAATSAQSIVDPDAFENTEANYQLRVPFGRSSTGGWRYLQVHDGLKGTKATLNEMAWRRDGDRGRHAAYSFRCVLILSTAKVAYDKIATSFAANHGANRQTVVSSKMIQWPATRNSTLPAPFEYVIKFDKPYAFDGTNGGLAWEAQVSNIQNQRGSYYFDGAYRSSRDPNLAEQPFGRGCVHSGEPDRMRALGSSSMNWPNKTGTLYLDGRDLPRNSTVIGILGFSRTVFATIPLPFLLPGSSNAYSGPCHLYVSFDIVIPGTASSSGNARIQYPVPAGTELDCAKIFGQYVAIDAKSTASIPLVTSNAIEYQWVEPYDDPKVSRVYASNNFATTGTTSVNRGLVTRMR